MHILIVSPYITKLFFPASEIQYGGAEVGQALLAEEFVNKGHRVSIVCCPPSEGASEFQEGVRFYFMPNTFGPNNRPGTVAVYRAIIQSLRAARPNLIYHACAGPLTALLSVYSKITGVPYVFRVANDLDLQPDYAVSNGALRTFLYRFGLRRAAQLIVQTPLQQRLLHQHFGLNATIIQNCKRISSQADTNIEREGLLWVGRLSQQPPKNPEYFLEMAERYPEIPCTMIAPGYGNDYERQIREAALRLPNMRFLSYVPNQEMGMYYARARLFVGTGTAEGFPNTYLEASTNATPVLSLVTDPDHYLTEHKAGIVVGSKENLLSCVGQVYQDRPYLSELGANGQLAVRKLYDVQIVAQRYLDVFNMALKDNTRSGSLLGNSSVT